MAFYGRTPGLTDEHLGTSTNGARASTYGTMPEHGWAYRWRGRIGRAFSTDSPQARGQFWLTSSGNPATLVGYTNPWTVTSPGFSTGQIGDVDQPLVEAYQMYAGNVYAIGFAGRDYQINYGINTAPTGQPTQTWNRAVADLGPHDPYNHTGTTWGQLASAIEYMPNVKPDVPVLSGAVGAIYESSPEFRGTFSDDNRTLPDGRPNTKERMKQLRIQLREVGSPTLLWNATYSATSQEQGADEFVREFAGTLNPDTPYEWRAAVSDQFDAWSDWSAWAQFTIQSGARLLAPRGVEDKITTQQPTGFWVDYIHYAGLDAELVEIELLQGGTPVRAAQQIAVDWAPNTNHGIDPSWGSGTGQWQPLDWGVDYQWRARVRDENGLWSPWTSPLGFWTNHRPQTPTNLRPQHAAASTLPTLHFTMVDLDDEPPALIGQVRIKDDDGTPLITAQATHIGDGEWELALTAQHVPNHGSYRWDARGADGVLTGAYSTEATFIYEDGPTVAITSPQDQGIVTSNQITIAWTADDQTYRRVIIYAAGTDEQLYNQRLYAPEQRQLTIDGTAFIRNGRAYEAVVEVENQFGIPGTSQRVRFTVQYPPAATVTGVEANPDLAAGDRVPSVYRVGWQPSSIPVGEFDGYQVYRLPVDSYSAIVAEGLDPVDEAAAIIDAAEQIAEIASISQTTVVDAHPPSGVGYAYAVTQRQLVGVEVISSLPAVAIVDPLVLDGIVIADRDHGTERRVVLDHLATAQIVPVRRQEVLETWAEDGTPVVAESPVRYDVLRDTYKLRERDGVSPTQQARQLVAMRDPRPDGTPTVVIYRDDLGRRVEGTITDLKLERRRLGRFDAEVEITGQEV